MGIIIGFFFVSLIVFIPTILFWRWLLKKIFQKIILIKFLTWTLTMIFTPIFTFFLLFIISLFNDKLSNNDRKFNKTEWVQDDSTTYPNRRHMVNSIIENKLLENKNTTEVENILGKADGKDTTLNGKIYKLYYTAQISYGTDIDPKCYKSLYVYIDTITNKVEKVNIEFYDRRDFLERLFTE